MTTGALCEVDQPLSDGNVNYHINNCDEHDVFRCAREGIIVALFQYLIIVYPHLYLTKS